MIEVDKLLAQSPWTLTWLTTAGLSLLMCFLPGPLFLKNDVSRQRKMYWTGTTGTFASTFFLGLPEWKIGLLLAFGFSAILVGNAYTNTNYIKINDRIYAYHLDDQISEVAPNTDIEHQNDLIHAIEPTAYVNDFTGATSAKKQWWLIAVSAVAMSWGAIVTRTDPDRPWLTPLLAAGFLIVAPGYGYGVDGSWGYEIARGQRLQFMVASVLTFGVFPLLYVPAYYAGRRWPFRNKRSMEYRVHERRRQRDSHDDTGSE